MSEGLVLLSPESERYNAELLFVHGLWVDARIWRGVAAGFAHRGWSCVLMDRPASSTKVEAAESWARRVERTARARQAAPVVVGHDAGALVALDLAARGAVRAAVAVAPLLDGTASVQSRMERLGRRFRGDAAPVTPPRSEHTYFARIPDDRRADVAGALGPEPAGVLREVDRLAVPRRPAVPALLVAHDADPVASPVLAEICARGIEADYLRLPGGHWPMLEPHADEWITRIHRWIVKRSGAGLLALRGDEDLVD